MYLCFLIDIWTDFAARVLAVFLAGFLIGGIVVDKEGIIWETVGVVTEIAGTSLVNLEVALEVTLGVIFEAIL